MTRRGRTTERGLDRRFEGRWVTRLSREAERRLYFYATMILLAAWAVSRLW